jgi:hypothetical protein
MYTALLCGVGGYSWTRSAIGKITGQDEENYNLDSLLRCRECNSLQFQHHTQSDAVRKIFGRTSFCMFHELMHHTTCTDYTALYRRRYCENFQFYQLNFPRENYISQSVLYVRVVKKGVVNEQISLFSVELRN